MGFRSEEIFAELVKHFNTSKKNGYDYVDAAHAMILIKSEEE
jgi:hypothetical protein